MPYCKKCGAELPEYAVFCTKCGLKYPVSVAMDDDDYSAPTQAEKTVAEEPPVVQNNAPTPAPQSNAPVAAGAKPASTAVTTEWFKNNSMTLYVILGVVAYVLLQFCTTVAYSSFGFAVTLGVFAILCAIAFCVVGVLRFVMNGKAAGNKHTTGDNICLALGIIVLVYVLFMTIAVLKSASDLLNVKQTITDIFA